MLRGHWGVFVRGRTRPAGEGGGIILHVFVFVVSEMELYVVGERGLEWQFR